jgi:regulator of replication initiation timing
MDALIESLQDRAEKLEDECNALRIENSNNRKVISTLQYRNIQLEQQLLAAQEALKKRSSQQLTVEDGPYSLQSFERYDISSML